MLAIIVTAGMLTLIDLVGELRYWVRRRHHCLGGGIVLPSGDVFRIA
ncbi:hypothetical protein ACFLIM_12755 [Nonomuraea sp. M3C6]|uniref:Uncharacterized protein n=1 Tax=Nonomuraea marmarensis TaxID=3351344 RepID=A0ABW7A9Q2_9ACTN